MGWQVSKSSKRKIVLIRKKKKKKVHVFYGPKSAQQCPDDKIRNTKSGRCVKRSGKMGRKILQGHEQKKKKKMLKKK